MTEPQGCYSCNLPLQKNSDFITCSDCGRVYHSSCWDKDGKCSTYACQGKAVYQPVAETEEPQQDRDAGANSGTYQYTEKGMHYHPPVENYLVWAILVTICCCLPFGIVAIVYAAQVNGYFQAGNYEAAVNASNNARTWCIIGLIAGILPLLFSLVSIPFSFMFI